VRNSWLIRDRNSLFAGWRDRPPLRKTAFADLLLKSLVSGAQLGRSFVHPQLEVSGLARDVLVEPGLLEHDGELARPPARC